MKTLFLIFLVVIGLFLGNLLVFGTACKVMPLQEAAVKNQSFDNLKTPTPTPSPAQVQWNPSAYLGIIPGQSTYKDVKKILGKPRSEGPDPESETEKEVGQDSEFNTLMQYSTGIEVTVGTVTKIVKSIGTPYPRMTKQQAVEKYGSEYFETDSASSCITNDQQRGTSGKKDLKYPVWLVYPEKGLMIIVGKDNNVIGIWFLNRCDN